MAAVQRNPTHSRPSHVWTLALALLIASTAASAAPMGKYILSRSPFHNPVCGALTRNLNQFRELPFNQCHPRLSTKLGEFSRPEWHEIPFDIALAEAMVKSATLSAQAAEEWWQLALPRIEKIRREGKARMWRTRIDVDGDGVNDTLIRMVPNESGILEASPPYSCEYDASTFVAETAHAPGKSFRIDGRDIVRYSGDGRYYSLEWDAMPPIGGGPFRERPDIGATAGVVVNRLEWYPVTQTEILGGGPECIVDWVPTSRHRPSKRRD